MYLQPNTFITSIIRMLYKLDNRQNTLELVQNTVDQCLEIIENEEIEPIVKQFNRFRKKRRHRNLNLHMQKIQCLLSFRIYYQRIDSKIKNIKQ